MNLFSIPEDFAALSDEELAAWIGEASATAEKIGSAAREGGDMAEFLSEDFTVESLMDEMTAGVAAIETAKAELAKRKASAKPSGDDQEDVDDDQQDASAASLEAIAALGARATELSSTDDEDADADAEAKTDEDAGSTDDADAAGGEESAAAEAVVAAASPAPTSSARSLKPLGRPARARRSAPAPEEQRIALTAAAENLGYALGSEIPDVVAVAEMMMRRRSQFGTVPEGTHGDKIPIARSEWSDLYPRERQLSPDDLSGNWEAIQTATSDKIIREQFEARRAEGGSLVASGGLCAPVTPYYNLQQIAVANRPVRAALPAFNAERGGIKAARPASIAAITTAVGTKTVDQDAAGGSEATKTCQVIDCPDFVEVDIEVVYHCLQIGNIIGRTFPELVANWNALVLAAHARTAETILLDGIVANSAQVTASDLGLGASSTLLSQAITAADGLRSAYRMDPNAVLRAMYPFWVLDLLVSDVYRSQFERFDMDGEKFVALLREANIEPTFYLDSPTGAEQVFDPQGDGALGGFPETINWMLFPEGSHLYIDGGILELGLVRDSVLNKTNDFQIFGESFENVAFVGVASLSITTTTCDSGVVSSPAEPSACGDYS